MSGSNRCPSLHLGHETLVVFSFIFFILSSQVEVWRCPWPYVNEVGGQLFSLQSFKDLSSFHFVILPLPTWTTYLKAILWPINKPLFSLRYCLSSYFFNRSLAFTLTNATSFNKITHTHSLKWIKSNRCSHPKILCETNLLKEIS